MKAQNLFLLAVFMIIISCVNDDEITLEPVEPQLIIKFKFDGAQERLDSFGDLSTIPDGNVAQTPKFNSMGAHYIELAQTATTLLGEGEIIYQGEETTAGGTNAIDFNKAIVTAQGDTFISIPISSIKVGSYNWVRMSISYQNYEIDLLSNGVDFTGTLASFVGFNTYITDFDLNGSKVAVNDNKLQGYWAFETQGFTFEGQAPEGATTVPNPLFDSSPIPQGSCVVTGKFENEFTIIGNEAQDVVLTFSVSVNNSFEWIEINEDGKYEPSIGEQVVDMGLRGLIPSISN